MKASPWFLILAMLAIAMKKKPPPPAPVSPIPGYGPPLVRWSDEDMSAFAAAARRAGVEPAYALAVYASESNLNPHALNPHAGAAGIPQLLPRYMHAYGADPETFHLLSVAEQIPVIERLLKSQVAMLGYAPPTASKLYHLNFYPATAKGEVVVTQAGDPLAYSMNKNFDADHKGYIDENDLRRWLERVTQTQTFEAVLDQLRRVDDTA